ADLLECAARLRGDLAPRLLEPALALTLGLLAHPLLHRLPRLPGLAEDLLRLAPGLGHQRAVLLEQPPGLGAGVVRLFDRAADLLAALVDHLLDRTERIAPEHVERDQEADDRPDHQPRGDRDQRVGPEQHQWLSWRQPWMMPPYVAGSATRRARRPGSSRAGRRRRRPRSVRSRATGCPGAPHGARA